MRFKSMAVFVFVWCMLVGSIAWGATEKSGLIYYPTSGADVPGMVTAITSRGLPATMKFIYKSGVSTYYETVSTSFPDFLELEFEEGAIIGNSSGNTITFLGGPDKITARVDQQIFPNDSVVRFTDPGVIEYRWWGDDTAALQSAAATMTHYFGLHIASGEYELTDTIDFSEMSHIRIFGDAQQNPRFWIASDITGGAFAFINSNSEKERDINIEHIEFRGSDSYNATADYALRMLYTPEVYCDNLKVINATNTAGVFLLFSWGNSFTNCYLRGSGAIDDIGAPSGVSGNGFRLDVGANAFNATGGRILNYSSGAAFSMGGAQDVVRIAGLAIESNMYGLFSDGTQNSNIRISDCYFEGTEFPIYSDVTTYNVNIFNNRFNGADTCISLGGDQPYISTHVWGNRFRNNSKMVKLRGRQQEFIYDSSNWDDGNTERFDISLTSIPESSISIQENIGDEGNFSARRIKGNLIRNHPLSWSNSSTTLSLAADTIMDEPVAELTATSASDYIQTHITISDTENTHLRGQYATLALPVFSSVTDPTAFQVQINDGVGNYSYTALGITTEIKWKFFYMQVDDAATLLRVRFFPTDTTNTHFLGNPVLLQGIVNDVEYPSLPLELSSTWNVGSLIDGAGETKQFTVLGAVLGDYVSASLEVDLQDMMLTGYVQAADTVELRMQNESGGTINLLDSNVNIRILKQ